MSGLGRYIVDAVVVEHRSPTQLARDHGISKRWVFELLRRFKEGGAMRRVFPRLRSVRARSSGTVPQQGLCESRSARTGGGRWTPLVPASQPVDDELLKSSLDRQHDPEDHRRQP